MQAICVFSRINGFQHGIGVYVIRQWQLHDVAGAFRIIVEFFDDFQNLVLASRFWQFAV